MSLFKSLNESSTILNKIKKLYKYNKYKVKGCNRKQIIDAQKALDIVFPQEFVHYVMDFGRISFQGVEWNGLNVESRYNVVDATLKQKAKLKDNFPQDCFVLENNSTLATFSPTIVDKKGIVYILHRSFNGFKKKKIANSIPEYLIICINSSVASTAIISMNI